MYELYETIANKIQGRIAVTENELVALVKATIAAGAGDHVEIGCLWGATAIAVALTKERLSIPGHVYTIDPMVGGWWDTKDPVANEQPTIHKVLTNFARFGVYHRMSIIRARSHPWPLPSVHPVSIFIDGAHEYETVVCDILAVKSSEAKVLVFHDYGSAHLDVKRAIDQYFPDPKWQEAGSVATMKIYKRKEML